MDLLPLLLPLAALAVLGVFVFRRKTRATDTARQARVNEGLARLGAALDRDRRQESAFVMVLSEMPQEGADQADVERAVDMLELPDRSLPPLIDRLAELHARDDHLPYLQAILSLLTNDATFPRDLPPELVERAVAALFRTIDAGFLRQIADRLPQVLLDMSDVMMRPALTRELRIGTMRAYEVDARDVAARFAQFHDLVRAERQAALPDALDRLFDGHDAEIGDPAFNPSHASRFAEPFDQLFDDVDRRVIDIALAEFGIRAASPIWRALRLVAIGRMLRNGTPLTTAEAQVLIEAALDDPAAPVAEAAVYAAEDLVAFRAAEVDRTSLLAKLVPLRGRDWEAAGELGELIAELERDRQS
ncbi:hypothetical protein [Pelagovum pacificum]|uniref:DUF2336 domain-containing protein n=1 Tax=Pelagovum pacificum TaxID=2588711 RepID=A0A5C5GG01_9RHOB|nr:hypothetical protein [Pelagovum pacificum]QQA43422.1 hypothetical protein I8N54_02280 [Pelagovum pacificum]TNY33440.1 hypothetical protein FHY64_09250 [Pelagovum pacificum]